MFQKPLIKEISHRVGFHVVFKIQLPVDACVVVARCAWMARTRPLRRIMQRDMAICVIAVHVQCLLLRRARKRAVLDNSASLVRAVQHCLWRATASGATAR